MALPRNWDTGGVHRDCDRPLTPRGARRVRRVARALRELGQGFDLVLSSPFARARQTAEIVVEVLGLARRLRFTPDLAIPANSHGLIQHLNTLRSEPDRVLLVGHEPHLGELTALLTTGGPGPTVSFRKAGLCRLEVGALQAGRCATIEWVLPPRLVPHDLKAGGSPASNPPVNMLRSFTLILLATVAVLGPGCSYYHSRSLTYLGTPRPAPTDAAQIEIIHTPPTRPHDRLGRSWSMPR